MDWGACVHSGVPSLDCIPTVFHNLIQAALVFAGVVALFVIIFSGIRMINSGGEAKALEGARKSLTYAIIGLVVVLLSFLIINVISKFTGTDCLNSVNITGCGNPPNP